MKKCYILCAICTIALLLFSNYIPTPRYAQASEITSNSGQETLSNATDPITNNETEDSNTKDIKLYVTILIFIIVAIIIYKLLFGGIL